MTTPPTMLEVDFSPLLGQMEEEQALRERIREGTKELDKATRSVLATLNRAHSTPSARVPDLVRQATSGFSSIRGGITPLAELIPENEYWKWNQIWSQAVTSAIFAASFSFYLGTGGLLSKEQVSEVLGVRPEWQSRFVVSTEEYLQGLISLVNELSRLAVNSVTLGDFDSPLRIASFVKDLHAGFQLLNLKNDSLRKRFDSLKYDIKKVEEVVYDVSLRGLLKDVDASAKSGAKMDEDEVMSLLGAQLS